MPSFTDDLAFVDPNTIEQSGPQYVMGQWHNGDPKLAAVGGVAHTGGLLIDRKYVSDKIKAAPGWKDTPITFESGKTSPMLAAQQAKIAVIRTRFAWFVTYNGVTTYYPPRGYQADSGMRGKLHALCAVEGYDFPVVFSFKGKGSQFFGTALKDFGQRVKDASNGAQWPRFAFWLTIIPGPHQKVGQKNAESIITPPVLDAPATFNEDYLSKRYVGRDKLIAFQVEYHKAADWAAAWNTAQAEPEHGPADEAEAARVVEEYDDDPGMVDVSGPVQTTAQMLGMEATFGAGKPPKRQNQYQAGR